MLTNLSTAALLVIGFGLTLFTSIGAKVLRHFSHRRLEELCRARRRPERFGEILDLHDEVAMAAEKLQTVCLVLVSSGVTLWLALWLQQRSLPQLAGLLAAALILVLAVTVWIPWAVVRHGSAGFLLNTWWLWQLVYLAAWPFRLGSQLFDSAFRRLAGQPKRDDKEEEEEAFEDEIMTMVNAGQREGLLEPDAREMIEGVIELGDADVADIMTPRSEVDALDIDLSWPEILQVVIECGRTRLPVYEKSPDNVIGVLYVKDLLPELSVEPGQRQPSIRKKLRPPWFIPRTMPSDDLLQDFLKNRSHLAIVLDEYGALEGVVTIEDVLEEIVGEIMDETDDFDAEEITFYNEHRSKVKASVHIDTVNERLGLTLPESDDYDTVGGFVVHRLCRVPRQGESIECDGLRLTVTTATPMKVIAVLIETIDQPSEKAASSRS